MLPVTYFLQLGLKFLELPKITLPASDKDINTRACREPSYSNHNRVQRDYNVTYFR
jgi:hypothetical protein